MRFVSRLFSRKRPIEAEPDEPLVPTPVPALGVLLLGLEKEKGAPLTEAEVLEARDNCVCMMLPISKQFALAESRGYEDIDPDNCWEEWLVFRAESGAENS